MPFYFLSCVEIFFFIEWIWRKTGIYTPAPDAAKKIKIDEFEN